ncbi:hypothetical protein SDC9_210877 [bioreactor metagenome]|uniref:Uncharacterized protein n=1 Tax=bioreactor metagenome TaxID=1076179 RepID=A0A645JV60_9ZZZZ
MRLWHEPRGRNYHAEAPGLVRSVLAPGVDDVRGYARYALHVLVGLGRQSEHKIELDRVVAALESRAARRYEVFLSQILVYDVAEPLASGLRRKGKAGLAAPRYPFHKLHGKVVRSQRRQ